MGMVALDKVESPEDMEALREFISEHHKHTDSSVAKMLLDDYGTAVTKFVKVSPCVRLTKHISARHKNAEDKKSRRRDVLTKEEEGVSAS